MNDRELDRIESEHKNFERTTREPFCPICGLRMHSDAIVKSVGLTDQWGGEVWAKDLPIPVWKCNNNHIIHFINMGYLEGRW